MIHAATRLGGGMMMMRRSMMMTMMKKPSTLLGGATTATAVRSMGTVTYSPAAWKIGKPAPKFTAVRH